MSTKRYIAKPVTHHSSEWHVIDTETGQRVGELFRGAYAISDATNDADRKNRIHEQRVLAGGSEEGGEK